jgi:hypothetical protein
LETLYGFPQSQLPMFFEPDPKIYTQMNYYSQLLEANSKVLTLDQWNFRFPKHSINDIPAACEVEKLLDFSIDKKTLSSKITRT